MPNMNSPRELFLHELGDALTFERTIVAMLPKLQQEASDKELAQGFKRHLTQSKQHVKNVEQAFKAIGEKVKAEACPGIEGIKREHDEFLKEGPSPEVLNAFLTSAAAKTEHYEIATYEGLIAKARALGEKKAADLLEKNLKEDKQTLQAVQKVGRRLAREGAKQNAERAAASNGGRSRASSGAKSRSTARSSSGGQSRSRSGQSRSRSGGSSSRSGGRSSGRR